MLRRYIMRTFTMLRCSDLTDLFKLHTCWHSGGFQLQMCLWSVALVLLHYIPATQIEHTVYAKWKWTYFAADRARSHSYPCAFQAPSHFLSSGKLHLYVHASGGWYNSSDAPQCWRRIMQFPYEWLWLHSTGLCTWKIGILWMRVCVWVCVYLCMYTIQKWATAAAYPLHALTGKLDLHVK